VLFSRSLEGSDDSRLSRTITRLEDDGRKIVHRQQTAGPECKERLVMELTMTRMVKARPASEWVSRVKLLP
jgi:hypothetical protein